MLVIDESTSRELLDMREAIESIGESFRAISTGPVVGLRGNVDIPGGPDRGLLLGAYIGPMQGLCFKAVGSWHGNSTGLIITIDTSTGRPEVIVSGTYVTDFRTGAASGVATEQLARQDCRRLAVLGTGRQAATQLRAMLAVRPIETVAVWNRTPRNGSTWIAKMRQLLGSTTPDFWLAEEPAHACEQADLVVVATRAESPVLRGEWLAPGCHINAVGAGSPLQRELHESVFQCADVMVVDSRELSLKVGDFLEPLARGVISSEEFAELGEVMIGTRSGRTHDSQISLFKSVGHAGNDLAVARLLARRAVESGRGVSVEL